MRSSNAANEQPFAGGGVCGGPPRRRPGASPAECSDLGRLRRPEDSDHARGYRLKAPYVIHAGPDRCGGAAETERAWTAASRRSCMYARHNRASARPDGMSSRRSFRLPGDLGPASSATSGNPRPKLRWRRGSLPQEQNKARRAIFCCRADMQRRFIAVTAQKRFAV